MHADMDRDYFQLEQRYFPYGLQQAKGTTKPFLEDETDVVLPRPSKTLYRLYILAFLMILSASLFFDVPLIGNTRATIVGAKAGLIRRTDADDTPTRTEVKAKRSDSPTDVCNRWGHQSALVNGTIYVYGGHASQEQDQGTKNTWTNDFISMDVTKDFQISSPILKGLPQPSGPPAVANAYLWQSYDTLYLYGGEVSDTPRAYPQPYSLWAYDIPSGQWTEHSNPKTSAGNNSDDGNQPVQQASEGAGVSVPQLGRGYYFAGHLDAYNTPGWPLPIPRVYLKSMIEYTFPGFTNDGVQDLSGGKKAGSDGVWRNITQGGIQDTFAFTIRADSAVVYVPGFGDQGILLSLGGGTNMSFSQMNIIDVYDIATSSWYKQATSGKYPILRVNPCAVAASAPDGSSTNIYMYGGQNLNPYENQTQYDDMWILTVPSFTWVKVDTSGQSVPPARVGHTCNLYNGQIIVIGGYNTAGLGCDTGFYVFDATNLTWVNDFKSLSGGDPQSNPQNQQASQKKDPQGVAGSFGYQVPGAVQSVIGGGPTGGATVTKPAQSATAGPLVTGKPITYSVSGTYTITGANGAVVTETGSTSSTGAQSRKDSGPNIGAIVGGVLAGFFFILACYLGFCAWVYRRQLALYKNHVAMTQRAAAGNPSEKAAFLASGETTSKDSGSVSRAGKYSTPDQSSGVASGSGNSGNGRSSNLPPVPPIGNVNGVSMPVGGNSTANSSTEDLGRGMEPSFVGVLLNPRRSLRVINRD
ncbi:MAG: hypothetical protein Q9191_005188 [Dirinaria sp. TL-2023a]